MRRRSAKKVRQDRAWSRLVDYLFVHRAKGYCECCGQGIGVNSYLGHHVIFRSRGGKDVAGNCLITSPWCCHDHTQYGRSGLPISVEEAQTIVRRRNEACGIADDFCFEGGKC